MELIAFFYSDGSTAHTHIFNCTIFSISRPMCLAWFADHDRSIFLNEAIYSRRNASKRTVAFLRRWTLVAEIWHYNVYQYLLFFVLETLKKASSDNKGNKNDKEKNVLATCYSIDGFWLWTRYKRSLEKFNSKVYFFEFWEANTKWFQRLHTNYCSFIFKVATPEIQAPLDILFRQITTFIKVRMAFIFGLQTL